MSANWTTGFKKAEYFGTQQRPTPDQLFGGRREQAPSCPICGGGNDYSVSEAIQGF
jgi:hypothetical protein